MQSRLWHRPGRTPTRGTGAQCPCSLPRCCTHAAACISPSGWCLACELSNRCRAQPCLTSTRRQSGPSGVRPASRTPGARGPGCGSSITPPCAGVDDERALYWGDRKPAGHGSTGSQFCRGCGKQFEGAITAQSNLLPRRYPGKPAGRLCPRCDQLQRGEVLAASDGVRDADPLEFAKAVAPVFACADTYVPETSVLYMHKLRVAASCGLCVPKAQGSLAPTEALLSVRRTHISLGRAVLHIALVPWHCRSSHCARRCCCSSSTRRTSKAR